MQSSDSCIIHLPRAEMTQRCGASLARSLYSKPLDCYLSGELGTGKTTFVRAFLQALGSADVVTSPTYALEQRYRIERFTEAIHLDLYRLVPKQARELLSQSDDHAGLRCIEWSERLDETASKQPGIHLRFQEEGDGRRLNAEFLDVAFPDDQTIAAWQKEFQLPENVIKHCNAVAAFALHLSEILLKRGEMVRPQALRAAALAHDLLRFVDFRLGAGPEGSTYIKQQTTLWEGVRNHYGEGHEEAVSRFLTEKGFPAIARIVRTHGARVSPEADATIEQYLLYYADKRLAGDTVVSVHERFADFNLRYSNGQESENSRRWRDEALAVEQMFFPEGVPF
ncbi:MAG TPA: tRNA (adenosine(37)-N6)-threonylcarbamoyltransferase complex ATPase subunit type 1 TsaE [Candidatus Peribacteraceae bacterium]|nr:tRNA (adenosine(37)-N6)-threonylcarbamoyltransferase complex ATPase subunit type 1 TsaE [Candidatus Peribacteraceae bacterium]